MNPTSKRKALIIILISLISLCVVAAVILVVALLNQEGGIFDQSQVVACTTKNGSYNSVTTYVGRFAPDGKLIKYKFITYTEVDEAYIDAYIKNIEDAYNSDTGTENVKITKTKNTEFTLEAQITDPSYIESLGKTIDEYKTNAANNGFTCTEEK